MLRRLALALACWLATLSAALEAEAQSQLTLRTPRVAPTYWSPHATAAPGILYSLYRLIPSYAGHEATLTRASDSATLNIDTGPDGQSPNLGPVPQFCAATTCTVKVFDQSGGANDGVVSGTPEFFLANAINGKQSTFTGGTTAAGTSANAGNKFPPAYASATRALSVVNAMELADGPLNSWGWWGVGNVSSGFVNVNLFFANTGSGQLYIQDNGTKTGPAPPIGTPITYSLSSGTANLITRVAGVQASQTAETVQALTGGEWGNSFLTGQAVSGMGEHFAFALYQAALTPYELSADDAVMDKVFAIQPKANMHLLMLFDGDSITRGGVGNDFGRTLTRDVMQSIGVPIYAPNIAIAGQTCATIFSTRSRATSLRSAAFTSNIATLMGCTNDIGGQTATWANTATSTATFTSASKQILVVSSTGMNVGDGFIVASNLSQLAKIVTVDDATHVTLDTFPTGTGSAVAVTTISYTTINTNADALYNTNLVPYVSALLAAGYNAVILETVIPRFWSSPGCAGSNPCIVAEDQERIRLNADITGGGATNNYTVADYTPLDSVLSTGVTHVPSSTYYYSSDLIHPNATGFALLAPILAQAARPLLH